LAEIRERAAIHIRAEEAIKKKRVNELQKQGKYKDSSDDHG